MLALPLTLSSARGAVANLAPATTPTYVPAFDTKLALTNSWWYRTPAGMGIDNGIFFGPGGTNLLKRNAQDLWYVLNDAAAAGFQVGNTNGIARMQISADGLTGAFQGGTGLAVFGLSSGASGIMAGSGYVVPLVAGLRLGSGGTPWGDANFKGVFYEWAAGTDTINYSRLAVSQTSTNLPVVFDNQTAGTAGYARGFLFQTNGVTRLYIAPDSGYTGAGTLVFMDDGKFHTPAAGATFNPTSTFVPYNNAGAWADSWWYYTANGMGTDTNIYFGPGTTNVLYRDGQELVYTNGASATGVDFKVVNGLGRSMSIGLNGSGAGYLDSSLGVVSVEDPMVVKGNIQPGTDRTYGIGVTNNSSGVWKIGNFQRVLVNSMDDAGGNAAWLSVSQATTNDPVVFNMQTAGTAGYARGYSFQSNSVELLSIGSGGANKVIASGEIKATNGFYYQLKSSFSTNFTCTTNVQFYMLDGTNQLITLPTAASGIGHVYRFSCTNGYGSFVLTNSGDSATIRDGKSLSYTNIGINEVGFISDGSNWWLASKGKQIFPSASWSLTNTITPVQDVITNIPFTTLEFNNSQGINLLTNAGWSKPTQLWVTNAGTYLITFSAVLKGSAGGSKISIWLRKDGSDVARTRTDQAFSGATAQQCMTVNYFQQVGATPSYFELVAASHDLTPPTIESAAPNPTGFTAPAMPGVIVTINRVSDTWP